MTELAIDNPAQRVETDAAGAENAQAEPAESAEGGGGVVERAQGFASDAAERVGDAAERAQEFASDAAERVGEAAERAQGFASDAAHRVGDAVDRAAAASGRVATQVADRLRNNAELAADRGTTIIANEVVEKIAGIAAREVPGVYDLGGDVARVFSAVKERVGLGPADDDQGVSVRLEGGTAAVRVTLVLEYGFVVHSVTEKVRAKVIGSVENLLGLEVTAVDIVVDDIHFPDTGPIGDDEARAAGYEA
jgi:uncharacterized alkaline shock family protein YloU